MSIALVTGSCGLISSETCQRFDREGFRVVGVGNDMRARCFGAEISTAGTLSKLETTLRRAHLDTAPELQPACESERCIHAATAGFIPALPAKAGAPGAVSRRAPLRHHEHNALDILEEIARHAESNPEWLKLSEA